MIDLLETSISDKANMSNIPHPDYQLVDGNGNLRTDISSEWGGYLIESGGKVSCSDCTFTDHNPYLVSGNTYSNNVPPDNTVGTIHTHPMLSGLSFMNASGSRVSFPSRPSGQDMRMHQSTSKAEYMNVVIDRSNIYLHNGRTTISTNHTFFRK